MVNIREKTTSFVLVMIMLAVKKSKVGFWKLSVEIDSQLFYRYLNIQI
jgi:hypothetical protein